MNKLLMKIFGSLAALTLVAIGISSPASAIVEKTCYVGLPKKIVIDPRDNLSGSIPWSQVTFSGDCPSNTVPTVSYGGFNYTSNGEQVNLTAAQIAVEQGALRFLYPGGGDTSASTSLEVTGQDSLGNDTREFFVDISFCGSLCGNAEGLLTPLTRFMETYTGNDSTDLADYKFIPLNAPITRYITTLSVKSKRLSGSAYLTVTINMNRHLDVFASGRNIVEGDKVTIKRGSRIIAKVTPNSLGYAKVRIRDIAGKNKYTVSVPATSFNWSAKKTFVK